jgi:hypothetical protein
MSFPPGTFQYARDTGQFRPVKFCPRCACMVSQRHEHWTEKGKPVLAMPDGWERMKRI